MVMQRPATSSHLQWQSAVGTYLVNSIVVCRHPPVEESAVICGNPNRCDFDACPIQMIVLTIPVAAFLVGLIVTLALFPDTKQPIRDGLGLLWRRRDPITDLEISNCNCTHDPALHVVGLIRRHLAGKRLVLHH